MADDQRQRRGAPLNTDIKLIMATSLHPENRSLLTVTAEVRGFPRRRQSIVRRLLELYLDLFPQRPVS